MSLHFSELGEVEVDQKGKAYKIAQVVLFLKKKKKRETSVDTGGTGHRQLGVLSELPPPLVLMAHL